MALLRRRRICRGHPFVCGHRVIAAASAEEIWKALSAIAEKAAISTVTPYGSCGDSSTGFSVAGPRSRPARRSGLRAGDTLDFWRVLQVEPPHHLQLLSEMKAPGDALLDFWIAPLGKAAAS